MRPESGPATKTSDIHDLLKPSSKRYGDAPCQLSNHQIRTITHLNRPHDLCSQHADSQERKTSPFRPLDARRADPLYSVRVIAIKAQLVVVCTSRWKIRSADHAIERDTGGYEHCCS